MSKHRSDHAASASAASRRLGEITDVAVSALQPHPNNPRRISRDRLDQLKRSLETDPDFLRARPLIALRGGTVIAGNQRLRAAVELGWSSVPVVYADVDEQTAKLWMLRDNNSFGDWDERPLAEMLAGLTDGGVEMALAGFESETVDELLGALERERARPEPDDAPPLPKVPRSRLGEVYEMGHHRLMCGDATDPDHVAELLGGTAPGLCVTDPPYGVSYDPSWRTIAAEAGHLAYAARRVGQVPNDDRADWRAAWDLFPGDVLYSWHPPGATSLVHAAAIEASGFTLRMQIIWAKSNFPISRGDYHVRHEPCWYAVRHGKPARRTRDRKQTTLWEINLDANVAGGHSTQKPVECMARPMRNHTFPDVYDPFCGSGTSLIAATLTNRRCFAMELDPGYCDVIRDRWEAWNGD